MSTFREMEIDLRAPTCQLCASPCGRDAAEQALVDYDAALRPRLRKPYTVEESATWTIDRGLMKTAANEATRRCRARQLVKHGQVVGAKAHMLIVDDPFLEPSFTSAAEREEHEAKARTLWAKMSAARDPIADIKLAMVAMAPAPDGGPQTRPAPTSIPNAGRKAPR